MLRQTFAQGYADAFRKFALAPTTPADVFVDNVEGAKDVPIDPTSLIPQGSPQPTQAPAGGSPSL